MEMSNHTPGPWTVEDPIEDQLQIVELGRPTYDWRFIATIFHDGDFQIGEVNANARLIAAAPEMLDMLKSMLASAYPHPVEHPTMWKAWRSAEALIAKVEGRRGDRDAEAISR